MLGKVGKSRVGAKSAGKSSFADLVNYVAREADGKGSEVDKEEMGVLNLTPTWRIWIWSSSKWTWPPPRPPKTANSRATRFTT